MLTSSDPFFEACGGTDPIRVEVLASDGTMTAAEFRKPFVLVGRDARADLPVPDPHMAARQLYLQLVGGRVFGLQLSDHSPILLARRPWESGWVRPGDDLTVGPVRVRVTAPDWPADAVPRNPLAPDGDNNVPGYAIEPLTNRSRTPRRFAYCQDLLPIGRANPAEFLVRHPDVSRCHAALVRTPAGLWVVDLLSRTGVAVNGTYAPAAEVRDQDEVTFGRVGVRIRFPDLPSAAPPTNGALVPVPAPSLEPILDQVAIIQKQTFDQVQEMLLAVMQMVGGVLNEQREYMRVEVDRLERIAAAARTAAPAGKALPAGPVAADPVITPQPAAPKPVSGRPQMDEVQLHAWLEQRLGALNQQQSAVWERFVRILKGG